MVGINQGMKKLVVTTANEFNDAERKEFESKLTAVFGSCEAEYHVDEELLGGVIIFDGSTVFDGSLKSKLERISDALKKD